MSNRVRELLKEMMFGVICLTEMVTDLVLPSFISSVLYFYVKAKVRQRVRVTNANVTFRCSYFENSPLSKRPFWASLV